MLLHMVTRLRPAMSGIGPSRAMAARRKLAAVRRAGRRKSGKDTGPMCAEPAELDDAYLPLVIDSEAARRHRVLAPTLTPKHVSAEAIAKAVHTYFGLT